MDTQSCRLDEDYTSILNLESRGRTTKIKGPLNLDNTTIKEVNSKVMVVHASKMQRLGTYNELLLKVVDKIFN